ncbi:ABC transporter permease [Sulfitobacter sp. F26204]|uniref:ABC transporter permease n=1 Tax=Sulfitobacter sp. F26204 TaxID=2996014 RepID=UPI00225E2019|nr:ABC transporter permease [Sulfitobacter sp. F26204]MCX7561903.1 ABC transporter permease [Sulfitobacter sp. F26204]
MLKYAFIRVLAAIPTLFLVTILVFFFIRLVPGDPAAMLVGDIQNIGRLEEVRSSLGLDRTIPEQFVIWIGRVVQGDLGVSMINKAPVLETILQRFAVTAQVVFISVLLTTLIAVPAGMIAAWKQNKPADNVIVITSIGVMSIPSFWIGLTLILIFGIKLGWLPSIGYVSLFEDFSAGAVYLIMPVIALVMGELGGVLRMTRASTIEVMRRDYITHARAKGLSEGAVLARHAFPNAFAPTLTVIGMVIGALLGGAAVIETVFTLPGLGRLTIEAISSRDYSMVQGILLVVAVIYVLINLITDLLYPLFDPRMNF